MIRIAVSFPWANWHGDSSPKMKVITLKVCGHFTIFKLLRPKNIDIILYAFSELQLFLL